MAETPSVYFPANYRVQWGYEKSVEFETLIEHSFGHEQRMIVGHPDGRAILTGDLEPLPLADRRAVREFLKGRSGRARSFWIFEYDETEYVDFPVGTGNGSAVDFTLPFMGTPTSAATVTNVKGDGTPIIGYTINFYTGLETYITYNVAPPNGVVLTADIVGRRRWPVRNMQDTERESFNVGQDTLGIWSVAVIEVK